MAVARHVTIPKLKPIQLIVLANMHPGQVAAQEIDPNGGWVINEHVRNAIFLAYQKHPVQEITEMVAAGLIDAVVPGTAPNVPADAIRISASVMEQWPTIKRQIRAVPAGEWPARRPYQAEAASKSGAAVVPFTTASFDPLAREEDKQPAPEPKAAVEAQSDGPEPVEATKTRVVRARDAVNSKLRGPGIDKDTQADIDRVTGKSQG